MPASGANRSNPGPRPAATKRERTILIFTLLNPMHADACCILGISPLLDKVLFARKDVEHDSRQGPVLRAAMVFMSALRSQDELDALRTKLLVCSCKPSLRSLHRSVVRPNEEVLELALFTITSTISDYFMRIGAGKFARVRPNTPADARPWPSSITDVIPAEGGERDVLVGLLRWAAHPPGGHSVFTLIGALARYWEPFALQVFELDGIAALATQHLQHAMDSYDPDAGPAVTFNLFITPTIACAQGFFHALSEIDSRATLSLLGPIYEEMYAIAVPIEPILVAFRSRVGMDDCRRWFALVRKHRPGWLDNTDRENRDGCYGPLWARIPSHGGGAQPEPVPPHRMHDKDPRAFSDMFPLRYCAVL